MRKAWIFGLLATAMLAPHAVDAQELDSRCQKLLGALCRSSQVGSCFKKQSTWDDLPARCHGPVQAMIEMEREALQQQLEDQQRRRRGHAGRGRTEGASFSCGGILRSRPTMTAGKVATVAEGQRFDSVEDTGVWTDDYKWFRVRYGGLEGYQWGGIFWTQGGREGTIPSCNG